MEQTIIIVLAIICGALAMTLFIFLKAKLKIYEEGKQEDEEGEGYTTTYAEDRALVMLEVLQRGTTKRLITDSRGPMIVEETIFTPDEVKKMKEYILNKFTIDEEENG